MTDALCSEINHQKYYSGEFDIEWGDTIKEDTHDFKKAEMEGFRTWLKENNYDYRFISWAPYLHENIKFENVILFDKSWKDEFIDDTSHPTIEGCENISEVIYDSFNR